MTRILVTGGSGFIGSHLLESLSSKHSQVLNVDFRIPQFQPAGTKSALLDIKDHDSTSSLFVEFNPDYIIHLAARTDLDGRTLEDYADNVLGTANVLKAASKCPSLKRIVIASTQYVVRPGVIPASMEQYDAYSPYGLSKVKTEQLTRILGQDLEWVIVRPTNIWGTRHPFLPYRIWHYINKGLYLHPGYEPIFRAYSHVSSVVQQVQSILSAPAESVRHQVFYVGERPVNFLDWVNAFSVRLRGRPVRVVPRYVWRFLAYGGDVAWFFPMNSARYERMTVSDTPLMDKTFKHFGVPYVDFESAVDETVDWLRKLWGISSK